MMNNRTETFDAVISSSLNVEGDKVETARSNCSFKLTSTFKNLFPFCFIIVTPEQLGLGVCP
jgi:hypothetical protein